MNARQAARITRTKTRLTEATAARQAAEASAPATDPRVRQASRREMDAFLASFDARHAV